MSEQFVHPGGRGRQRPRVVDDAVLAVDGFERRLQQFVDRHVGVALVVDTGSDALSDDRVIADDVDEAIGDVGPGSDVDDTFPERPGPERAVEDDVFARGDALARAVQ